MKRTTGVSVMAAWIFDRTSWDRKRRQPTVRLEVKAVVTEDRSKLVEDLIAAPNIFDDRGSVGRKRGMYRSSLRVAE